MHQNDESMTEQSTKGIKGTPIYLPHESWDKYEFKDPGDVYAFSLMTLKKPFDGFSQSMLCKKVCFDCYRPEFECEIPQCYKNLTICCWSQNPDQRPTFEGIVKELKFNEDFITDTVDKEKYLN